MHERIFIESQIIPSNNLSKADNFNNILMDHNPHNSIIDNKKSIGIPNIF